MRYFLKDFAFTFIAIGLMLSILELYIDYRPCEFTAKYKEWYNNKENITTLLIGNSQIQANVNARVLGETACNMAISDSDIKLVKSLVHTYIPQMPKITELIINYDYYNIVQEVSSLKEHEKNNKAAIEADKKWWGFIDYVYSRYLHVKTESTRNKYAILCGQLHFKTLHNPKITDLNIITQEADFDDMVFHPNEKSKEQYYSELSSLIDIAKIAKEYGCRLIAITSPQPKIFLDATTPENVDFMNNIMDSLSSIFPIEYKNYLFDPSFLDNKLYADVRHFNHKGSTLFTQRLKEDFNL